MEKRLEHLRSISSTHKDLNMWIDDDYGACLNDIEEDMAVMLPPVIDIIALSPSRDGTIFLCSDPIYFYRFTAPLLLSLESLAKKSRVQIHIVDAEFLNLSVTREFLANLKHVQCGLSVESSGLGEMPLNQKANYHHAIRYVRLFQALYRGQGSYCLADVDGLFVQDPADIFTSLSDHDMGICVVPGMWHSWAHFRAAFTVFTKTESGLNFMRLVAAYISDAINKVILLLPNYSVLIVCDDTKVVGNGVSDCFPFPGQGLVEEPEDGLGELSEIGIKPVVRHMPVHDAP